MSDSTILHDALVQAMIEIFLAQSKETITTQLLSHHSIESLIEDIAEEAEAAIDKQEFIGRVTGRIHDAMENIITKYISDFSIRAHDIVREKINRYIEFQLQDHEFPSEELQKKIKVQLNKDLAHIIDTKNYTVQLNVTVESARKISEENMSTATITQSTIK